MHWVVSKEELHTYSDDTASLSMKKFKKMYVGVIKNTCMLHTVLQVHEELCTLCTPELHHPQCAEIQEDASKSKEYGINTSSVLNEPKYFHTWTGALIPDSMHDLGKGVK